MRPDFSAFGLDRFALARAGMEFMLAGMSSLIPETWNVPESFRQELGERFSHQKALTGDKHLLLVLHHVPEPGVSERKGGLYWRDPEGHWNSTAEEDGLAAIKSHLASYEKRIDALEEDSEKAKDAKDYFLVIKHMSPMVRAVANLAEALQTARNNFPRARDLILLRDKGHELQRSAELLLANVKASLDFAIAEDIEKQAANSQNIAKAGHRLNLIVALFLPVTAIASVFGMNLESGLDTGNILYFWLILAAAILTGYLLRAFVERPPV